VPADTIREFLERRIGEGRMPGAAWWVGTTAEVISRGAVGQAQLEPDAVPVTEATPYDLASLTKALATAPLLLLLEQQGALSLDDPAARYLGRLQDSPYAPADLRSLATHTAGLPAWHPCYLEADSLTGYIEQIAALPPAAPAGSVLYSDLGYILLGAILEQASGLRLDRLFERHIADPLGLRRTGFATSHERFSDAAATERGNAHERSMAVPAGATHNWRSHVLRGEVHDANAHGLHGVAGHAGLFSTLDEVATLGRMLLTPNHPPLSDAARARLLRESPRSPGRTVGLVTAAASSAARGALPDSAPGHTGFSGTSIWFDPASNRQYILLTNRVHPEVGTQDFQQVRHEFHTLAATLRPAG